ncbi:RagB/SusD family nutrient uptake outer membrane protein [Marinimicrobium alkaliphilum]|uniref:RagB/SusD family nutrient uptake outer membrane protein n=1 Tax=Marinimicrobium alkaliphilum TaxID=2202654 RepID=UPI000DBA5B13|nr:RagB/SusD family nutrient uptake outer membrane protein [Marinimicrobium alkaliphilum]
MQNKYKVMLSGFILSLSACDTSLDVSPKAALSEEQVTSEENLDRLVTAAYSYLGNDHYTAPHEFWATGNLRAGDAHKGGNGPSDIFAYHALSVYEPLVSDGESFPPDMIDLNNKMWVRNYTGISRANTAIRTISAVDEEVYPLKQARIAELRFIRGFFYSNLKVHYKHIPYVTEEMTNEEVIGLSNRDLSDQQLWDRIAEDFQFAADNLPEQQSQIGRVNRYAAMAYLAKTRLSQAYVQDDEHRVVEIRTELLEEVVDLVEQIEESGQYALVEDFAENFLYEHENNEEVVFQIMRSRDDGSPDGRAAWPWALSPPQSPEFGCCGFHVPTDNFVNAFKTDGDGLPMFDSFNATNYDPAQDAVDPRLDHTVSMEGKPFKYDEDLIHQGNSWARTPGTYGNFVSMKELQHPDCDCLLQNGPFIVFSKNSVLVRYADVLLWKAEALIELERQDDALPIINRIRERAAGSTGRLADGYSTYNVGTYDSFANQEQAREALRWERRLELGLEGHRFFDLIRWGVAKDWIDDYLEVEQTRRSYLSGANFQAGKHEYMPIPQQQINLSGGLYVQNPGYVPSDPDAEEL